MDMLSSGLLSKLQTILEASLLESGFTKEDVENVGVATGASDLSVFLHSLLYAPMCSLKEQVCVYM